MSQQNIQNFPKKKRAKRAAQQQEAPQNTDKLPQFFDRFRNQEVNLLNAMLEPENEKKKKTIWVGSLVTAGLTVIPASLYYFRLASVLNM